MSRVITWLIFSALLSAEAAQESLCSYSFDEVGASFDLSPLNLKSSSMAYHVQDQIDSIERNYTYIFNVCGNVGSLPDAMCWRDDGLLVSAYQLSEAGGFCHRLNSDAKDNVWDLIDDFDPSKGVTLTYVNGDHCNRADTSRSLTLNFICADQLSVGTFGEEKVTEDSNMCNYQISVESIFGCPRECLLGGNRRMCSGNGFCGMDTDLKKPKCFCYGDFKGDDCSVVSGDDGSGWTGTAVVLLLVLIVLIVMNVAGGILYYRIRNMQWKRLYNMDDPNEHQTVFSIGEESSNH